MEKFIFCITFMYTVGKCPVFGFIESDPSLECGMEETMEEELALMGRTFFAKQPWPNGQIPFEVQSSVRPSDRQMFQSAMDDFHKFTCVRFRPRRSQDKEWMTVRISFNTSRCGTGVLCFYKGRGAHYIEISSSCSDKRMWTHEMSHILCLGHEQSRSDRNDFLSFENCKPNQIPPIPNNQELRGQIYDYNSVMHYPCIGCYGKPIMSPNDVKRCGPDVSGRGQGLNVLDIEKINEYYGCFDGCKRHRWYNVRGLTQAQMRSVVNFASRDGDDEPVYLCRGYGAGDISVGWYRPPARTCLVSAQNSTFNATEHIQLFALPRGSNIISSRSKPYRMYSNPDRSQISKYLALGRRYDNLPFFAATGQVEGVNGKPKTVIGRVNSNYFLSSFIPGYMGKGIYNLVEYNVLGCSEE